METDTREPRGTAGTRDTRETRDRLLVQKALEGDRTAFGTLYEYYLPRIYRYLYHRTLNRETAEDLTSRSFLKALDKLESYSPRRGSFSAWLYRIAGNSLIDHYRREGRSKTVPAVWDEVPSAEDFVPDVHNRLCWEQVRPLVGALPPDKREILFLRIWDGLSFPEIAEITGKSEGACKMGFSRTLEQLRKHDALALVLLIIFGKLF